MKIIVFHVDAHTCKTDEIHKYYTVDNLAAAAIKLKAIYKTIPQIKSAINFAITFHHKVKDLHIIIEVQWDLDGTLMK